MYHFRKNLGDNNILSYGQHNRVVRFFDDQYQLEELHESEAQGLRIVQGHGVDQNIFSLLPRQNVKLLVVLRNPIGLTKSRYNHQANSLEKVGKSISAETFLKQNPGNFMSKLLLDKFPMFIDPDAETDLDKITSVLRKFEYVYTTEQLDNQSAGLMNELSLPHGLERRRVSSKKRVLEQTDAEIATANNVDMELFETANQCLTDPSSHNPFGFDREARDAALVKIAENGPSGEEKIESLYKRLANSLVGSLRAESALAKLEIGKNVALNDPKRFGEILEVAWNKKLSSLTDEQSEISKDMLAKWKANNKHWFPKIL